MGNNTSLEAKPQSNGRERKERIMLNNKYLAKDPIMEILESLTPKSLRKPFNHFVGDYKIKKNLKCQRDPFFQIKVVENLRSGRYFNLKILKKSEILKLGIDIFKSIYQSEISVLEQIKNPNVENIINIYFDETRNSEISLFIVTSYTPKMTLLDYINKYIESKRKFTIKDISIIMKILIELEYKLKSYNIIYRNYSPENIFFYKESNFFTLCLRNFYFCTSLGPNETTRSINGQLWYLAPEVIKELPYDYKSNMWSLGIILYQLITLENPVQSVITKDKLYDLYKNPGVFKSVSELKVYEYSDTIYNLLQGMLVDDPNKRKSIDYVIESPLLTSFDKLFLNIEDIHKLVSIPKEKIQEITYRVSNIKILHDVIFYIVYNLKDYFLSIEDITAFNELYKFFDRNNDGLISFTEIEDQLVVEKVDKDYARDYSHLIMNLVDCEFRKRSTPSYQHSSITYNIFITANILLRMNLEGYSKEIEKNIEIMFIELDTDHSGTITIDEIQQVFKFAYDKNIKKVLDEVVIHELFDRDLVDNLNSIKLEDFKNLLMYKVVKLKSDQEEEINRCYFTGIGSTN